jgi:uncharacterized SAM-binding protein YcdF (DUF218 family)
MNKALEALGISEDPYQYITDTGYDTENLNRILAEASQRLNTSLSPEAEKALYDAWDYLTGADPIEQAEAAIVFGGGGNSRPELAAKLYKEGWVEKLVMTGHSGSYMNDDAKSEAELFAEIAMKEQVPPEDIIVEPKAKNTIENAIFSLEKLKELGPLPEKIILIQIEYQMLRAYLTFKAVADKDIKLIRQPAPSAKYTRERFWENKTALGYVFNEFIKIGIARNMGHI